MCFWAHHPLDTSDFDTHLLSVSLRPSFVSGATVRVFGKGLSKEAKYTVISPFFKKNMPVQVSLGSPVWQCPSLA